MKVISKRLVDSILIMPNVETTFGADAASSPLEIAAELAFDDIAQIYLTKLGAIGIRFLDTGSLASIDQLDAIGGGAFAIPEHVTARKDEVVALQGRRLLFANFVAGALFGRICAIERIALSGAISAGMNDILVFERRGDVLAVEQTSYTDAIIGPKFNAVRSIPSQMRVVPPADLADAVAFTENLAIRAAEFGYANLQVCIAMNYQAAVLHRAQLAPASFAINFSVAEALVNEIFYAYGAVAGEPRRAFASQAHTVALVSAKSLRDMNLATKLERLEAGGLLGHYLSQRLQQGRKLRNNLMHGAFPVAVTQSGELQTMVRDLWTLLLDQPFELNAGYAMRY